ncbi:Uncharacterized protein BP5553_02887 [Venustampulla echinocandica]|uniref:Uncharacterized protein n=1 Tax=Venustampulla echinocandica TaxID=2656787 RepID=A0A370TSP2_9HELO|nr:Uncharacterized protein BP5553_02887 [Venustampulla echinocandica]RDL38547.1 Uncharacterized protein BP5553_02887 [Venustampulla echinocandica]
MATDLEPRKVPLEVLHLSMPRTGSVSMKAAYEILGLPTYHGFVYIENGADQIEWEKACDAKYYGKGKPYTRADFDNFLGGYAVLSDFPVLGFTEEFLEMYPDAKVVLVERDIEKWYHSFNTHIITAMYNWMTWVMLNMVEPFIRTRPAGTIIKMEYGMFNCSNKAEFQASARDTYRRHYAKVRELTPKENLLEYKLGSGWEPLCTFLGKDIPDVEFPFLNESKEFAIWMHNMQKRELARGVKVIAKALIPAGGLILAALYYRFYLV